MASTENLAIALWEELWEALQHPRYRLHCLQLFETPNNSVTYYGPNGIPHHPQP